MEDFIQDIKDHVEGYYNSIVAVTPKLLMALIVIVLAWFIASRAQVFANRRLITRMSDALLATFISNLIKALLLIIGIVIIFRIVGLTGFAQSILAGAGISAFIIGFALKDIGENFLAGILLAFKRPFTVGEIIESNGVKGKVIALNLRDTQIKSEGKDIFIPNALLIKNTLINYNSEGFLLQNLTIGLEYQSDYNKAIEIIRKILLSDEQVLNKEYSNNVVVTGITGSIVQVSISYWVETGIISDGKTRSEILIKIMDALKVNEFKIV